MICKTSNDQESICATFNCVGEVQQRVVEVQHKERFAWPSGRHPVDFGFRGVFLELASIAAAAVPADSFRLVVKIDTEIVHHLTQATW